MDNLPFVAAGYLLTAVMLGLYVVRLRMRARDSVRRVRAIVDKRDR